ncbi:MAG: hypothetical protein B7Y01_01440 [Xanthobacter sp. 17-67-6]|nr:MAG: hypothetical protein B7Y01_01440 [Xanthobacter sp. 17-67-6]
MRPTSIQLIRITFWCSALVLAIASLVPVDLLPRQAATIWDKGQHAFGFGWSPCVGPVLAAILIVAGAESSLWRGALLLAFYAAGIGIPFLAAAAFAGPFLVWARAVKTRLGLIEKVSGALLVATGLVFVTGLMPEVSQLLLDAVPALGTIG